MLNIAVDTYLNTFHLSVSFQSELGKTTVLLGENGAGKSTVLRLAAGLLQPERGHISLDDVIYFDRERRIVIPPQERPFGFVFQDYVLFPHLTVFENVAFGLRAQGYPFRVIRQRVREALEQVRLVGLEQRRPAQLSGGQQQRVAIARALALQPKLLLLDEPLAALDVQTRREVRQELRRILAEVSVTTVMVTHQYLEALLFGHQIIVLDHGSIVQMGGQRDLLAHPRSSYVAELVGLNFLSGRVVRYEGNAMCVIQLRNGGHLVEVMAALDENVPPGQLAPLGAEASVIVDPRSITLYPEAPNSSARNVFNGTIVHVIHSAAIGREEGRVRVSILLDDALPPLTAEVTETSALRLGLEEGKFIYASFKATEAKAYI